MKQKSTNIQHYAMYFGTYMGIYWILKFILFPLSFTIPFLSFLFVGLTIGVPFMGYYYLKTYRNKICGGTITFNRAFAFTALVYLFASMLTAVAHFVYFQFIDQGMILEHLQEQVNLLLDLNENNPDYNYLEDTFNQMLNYLSGLTATDITLDNLSRNTFIGVLMAIPTALIGRRKPKSAI